MNAVSNFITYLQNTGYNSRSNKHSNELGRLIAYDLATECEVIKQRSSSGDLVFQLNFSLIAGTADWNADLVIGPPPSSVGQGQSTQMTQADPSTVQIAIELKTVMTEHRKAIKNRKRDFEAHHAHVHDYDRRAIAGGVLVLNASEKYKSTLRGGAITSHRNIEANTLHCVTEFRSIIGRQTVGESGLDARCLMLIEFDNIDLGKTRVAASRLAPHVGDPIHNTSFLRRICDQYVERFS